MHFCDRETVRRMFQGKRVAIVGSGPGCLDNEPGFIDGHDVVLRVNNYRTGFRQGARADVFYSFFGSSIRKTAAELTFDGVKLCLCKCPDAKFMSSEWHRKNHKQSGVDFRYIYRARAEWWFCPTYVPTVDEFLEPFNLLEGHVPSTGFSAIFDVLSQEPAEVYLTGFDFFSSQIHNVDERWKPGRPDDPIGHSPERERAWLRQQVSRVTMDPCLTEVMRSESLLHPLVPVPLPVVKRVMRRRSFA